MRLVTFRAAGGAPRAGVLLGPVVVDISAAAPLVFEDLDDVRWELIDILRGQPDGMGVDGAMEIAAAVLEQVGINNMDELETLGARSFGGLSGALSIGGAEMLLPLGDVRLLAPLPRPASLRQFSVFEEHVAAVARARQSYLPPAWYDTPAFFFANHHAIYGSEVDLPLPRTEALDYGLGLACVIGREGHDIAEEDAEAYIAGYLLMNSWSARDVEREERSIGLGPAKSRDAGTSLGPTLVTPDELEGLLLPDGRFNMPLVARVDGLERSRGNARDSFYTFAQMIAYASRDAVLLPGDVLGSGEVGSGSLLSITGDRGPWLQPGDTVELEAAGLGVLRNQIV